MRSPLRPAPAFNPFAPDDRADPYPTYRDLREHDPVHRSQLGFWALSRYEDVVWAQRDPRLGRFSERALSLMRRAAGADAARPLGIVARRWLVLAEPDRHRRFRADMGRWFGAPAIGRLRPRLEAATDELLDAIAARRDSPVDLVAALAHPLPAAVVCELVGLGPDERERCRSWAEAIGGIEEVGLSPARVRHLAEAVLDCEAHLRAALSRPRPEGVPEELAGPGPTAELVTHLALALFGAAYETSVSFLGNAMLALLQHPDQAALLRGSPDAEAAAAVEELLRFDTPVQYHSRWAREELPVGGQALPAGARVLLLMGAANRDPRRYADPDRLDLTRADVHPTSFGGGPHVCLGAALARLVAQVALPRLVRRFPAAALVEAPRWRGEPPSLRALEALPATLS